MDARRLLCKYIRNIAQKAKFVKFSIVDKLGLAKIAKLRYSVDTTYTKRLNESSNLIASPLVTATFLVVGVRQGSKIIAFLYALAITGNHDSPQTLSP